MSRVACWGIISRPPKMISLGGVHPFFPILMCPIYLIFLLFCSSILSFRFSMISLETFYKYGGSFFFYCYIFSIYFSSIIFYWFLFCCSNFFFYYYYCWRASFLLSSLVFSWSSISLLNAFRFAAMSYSLSGFYPFWLLLDTFFCGPPVPLYYNIFFNRSF